MYDPGCAFLCACKVSTELPEPALEVGLKSASIFKGRPVTLKSTVPAKPSNAVTLNVKVSV